MLIKLKNEIETSIVKSYEMLAKVDRYLELNRITAKRCLKVDASELLQIVSKLYGYDVESIKNSREHKYTDVRYIIFHILRLQYNKMQRYKLKIIADYFGCDHTAVIYGLKKCNLYLEIEESYINKKNAILTEFLKVKTPVIAVQLMYENYKDTEYLGHANI